MSDINRWKNLPTEIMVIIVQKLSFIEDYFKLSAVCKSWKSNISNLKEDEKPPLPLKSPLLLLGEQAPQSVIVSNNEEEEEEEEEEDDNSDQDMSEEDDDSDQDMSEEEEEEDESDQDMSEEEGDDDESYQDMSEEDGDKKNYCGHSKNLVFYSILSATTYNIELPEARGRAILGTDKGWLITLGRDLQINLLHPLLRHQIPLPPMLTFPPLFLYDERCLSGQNCNEIISKVVLSSTIPAKSKVCNHHIKSPLIIMVIYGADGSLAFTRLEDKAWTRIKILTPYIVDIVCHKAKFYAVNLFGDVCVCDINECSATLISSTMRAEAWGPKYLVESSLGLDLFLVARFKYASGTMVNRTNNFLVWKLELKYSDSSDIPSYTWIECDNLGSESIFVGVNSSVSLPSSDKIKPNCIYFTDDDLDYYKCRGDSYDMGFFDLQSRTIESHFQGKPPVYPVSPPLWYI